MDKVKLGRALGYGARHAAKAMAQAVDAATTPSPRATGAAQPAATRPAAEAARPAAEAARPATGGARPAARPTVAQVATQAKAAGKSAWAPVARFSSVIWLQVTGSFFALIAVVLGQSLWVRRGVLGLGARSYEAQKLYGLAVVFLLFAYFAVSNFVRAARRGRG